MRSALLLVLLASSSRAEVGVRLPDRAHVIVHKRLVSSFHDGAGGDLLVKGRPFTVVYTITNLGSECVALRRWRPATVPSLPPRPPLSLRRPAR